MSKIKNIIFDLDGTLWDSREQIIEAWKNVISDLNINAKDLDNLMGKTNAEYIKFLFPNFNDKEAQKLMEKCEMEEVKYLTQFGAKLYDNIIPIIKDLSKSYKLFIVSNCQKGYIESFLEHYNLTRFFLAPWKSTGADYYYGAFGRLLASKIEPQLTCPTASDKFTVNISNGNGALTYPVGLITADELAMAGGLIGSDNSSYYLYTNQTYWSGSPFQFDSSSSSAGEIRVQSEGYISADSVATAYGARPVVSLSSKAKLSGNGTYSNPYTVS